MPYLLCYFTCKFLIDFSAIGNCISSSSDAEHSYYTSVTSLRARLHQASALTQSQRCGDTCHTALIQNNGTTPEWVATPFWNNSLFTLISMRAMSQATSQR